MPQHTVKDNAAFRLSLSPTDAQGNPVEVDGAPSWENLDPDFISLVVSADGLSADGQGLGNPTPEAGGARVRITADVDLGSGTEHLVETHEVVLTEDGAVDLGVVLTVL